MKKTFLLLAAIASFATVLNSCKKEPSGDTDDTLGFEIVVRLDEILVAPFGATTILPVGHSATYDLLVFDKKTGEALGRNISISSSNADVCECSSDKASLMVKKAGEAQITISFEDIDGVTFQETANLITTETYLLAWCNGKRKSFSSLPSLYACPSGYTFVFADGKDDPATVGQDVLKKCELYNVDFPVSCTGSLRKPESSDTWSFYAHIYNSPTWDVRGFKLLLDTDFTENARFAAYINDADKIINLLLMDNGKGFAYFGRYAESKDLINY